MCQFRRQAADQRQCEVKDGGHRGERYRKGTRDHKGKA
jgi:hypothetical protein